MNSDTVASLLRAKELAWRGLVPAFNLAIAEARQAEYEAKRSSILGRCEVKPAYPPWVSALAASGVRIKKETL